ncbi:DUF2017 family protein [Verrucomicrobium sp. 3C]|uniref:DUF2017 family protein n=1 Tax=Verrucomicrobium sp. 3C TaxID=1134055 RepID=UPI000373E097|nr:DUF2017 family protein [Verrucomicrobium sp. 3C]
MKVARHENQTVFHFEPAEREILLASFLELRKHYQTEFSQLPEELQQYWRGTMSRGEEDEAILSAAEELEVERLSWRSERLALLDKWLAPDSPLQNPSETSLTLSPGEVDEFLSMLNDRRLTIAVAEGIAEEQMDWDPLSVGSRDLQRALWEIHFLAYLQESCVSSFLED